MTESNLDEDQSPKRIALELVGRGFRYDVDGVLELVAPDVRWWTAGDPSKMRLAGERNRDEVARFMRKLKSTFPDGMQFDVTGVTAEGERVAIEARAWGRMADGFEYENRYHILVQVRDGKAYRFREYFDTHYAFEVSSRKRA